MYQDIQFLKSIGLRVKIGFDNRKLSMVEKQGILKVRKKENKSTSATAKALTNTTIHSEKNRY